MSSSVKVPLYKEIKRVEGTQDNSCDFCMQMSKDGFSGDLEISMPVMEAKMVVDDYDYDVRLFGESRRIISKYDYKSVIMDWKKENLNPIVCDDCIRSMYKSLTK